MRPRDRFLCAAFTIGYVVAVLWAIVFAVETAWILDDGTFFSSRSTPPTTVWQRLGVAQQSISRALLGIVMTVILVRAVERIRRRYRVEPSGFPVQRRGE